MMHFRLHIDLPNATLNELGGSRELSDILALFAGSVPHGLQSCGPVHDIGDRVCGHYLLLVNRQPVNEEE